MTDHNSSHPVRTSEPVIHRGPWVIAGPAAAVPEANQDIIKDGALLVADGLIQAVGKFRDIAREYGHFTTVDHEGCVLAPALINGHCHLELSHLNLAGRTSRQRNYNGDITAWIRDLLAEREKFLHIAVGAEEIILNSARRNL
ncbi:MAG: hypothetical protein R3297_11445 [Desulfobulbales bacterium]|nr:hypothetical protein [Desulfobulbales bacterium]